MLRISRAKRDLISRAEGDGQENRRLGLFSFHFLNGPIAKRAGCAQKCAQTNVSKTRTKPTTEGTRVAALSVKGDGLKASRLYSCAIRCFGVSAFCHVYLQLRGEVAERLKAAVC